MIICHTDKIVKRFRRLYGRAKIEIPKEIALSLKIPLEGIRKRLLEEFSLHLYKEGYLSFGKSRELAGMSKWEFSETLGKKGIPRHYSADDLEEDLQFANGE